MTSLPLFPAEPVAPRRLPTLSNNGASTYRRCPRLYRYTHIERMRSRYTPAPLRFGLTMHAGLESWLKGPADIQGAVKAILARESDPFEAARAHALMAGYHVRWGSSTVKALHVELSFETPLINPHTGAAATSRLFNGRLDAVVEYTTDAPGDKGRIYVMEHKTTGSALDDVLLWQGFRLASQCADYLSAQKALGFHAEGVIYDVMRRPDHRPLKAVAPEDRRRNKDGTPDKRQRLVDETPEEFFQRICKDIAAHPTEYYARRVEVRLHDELRAAQEDLWATHEQILWSERTGQWPRATGACRVGRDLCAFAPVCRGERQISDATLYEKRSDDRRTDAKR